MGRKGEKVRREGGREGGREVGRKGEKVRREGGREGERWEGKGRGGGREMHKLYSFAML